MLLQSKSLAVRTNYLVLIVVAIYLASQMAAQFALGKSWIEQNLYVFLIGNQIFIIFLPAAFFAYREKLKPVPFFRIKKISIPEGLLIVFMALTASYIASVLNAYVVFLLERAGPVKMDDIPVPQSISELWIQIFVIAVLPAVCEELFFRGIIYRAFEGLGTKMAIGISALYFALFHFDIRNLLGPLFLGVLIAWYCCRTGSILAGVLAHFVNNLLAILASWFNRGAAEGAAGEPMLLTNDMLGPMFVFACFTTIVLMILIKAFESITRGKALKEPKKVKSLPMSIMLHWPVCFFYGTYVIIGVLFIASLSVH